MDISSHLPFAVATSTTLLAAALDRWRARLYDVLTLPLLAAGLAYHAATEGPAGLAESLLGLLAGSGVLIAFYILGEVNAPEVKLMAAVGAWVGLPFGYYAFAAGALASGGFALGLMAINGMAGEALDGPADDRPRIVSPAVGPADRAGASLHARIPGHRMISIAVMVALGVSATLAWIRTEADPGRAFPSNSPAPAWPVAPAASIDRPPDPKMISRLADFRHSSHPRRNT